MIENATDQTVAECSVRISRNDEWAIVVLSLAEAYTGGKIVRPSSRFFGSITGLDALASQYEPSNWFAGLTSGVLYAYRTLKAPRRIVKVHQLNGSMRGNGLQSLANAAAAGVAKLLDRPVPLLQTHAWRMEHHDPPEVTHASN